jgi:hypothetical protein
LGLGEVVPLGGYFVVGRVGLGDGDGDGDGDGVSVPFLGSFLDVRGKLVVVAVLIGPRARRK